MQTLWEHNSLSINGIRTYNPDKIANSFSLFYEDLGETLASKITPGNKSIDDYIGNIPRTLNSIVIRLTMQSDVEKLISALPNKTSSWHNQVSNKLLKDLGNTISFPLSLIFNQSLESGVCFQIS